MKTPIHVTLVLVIAAGCSRDLNTELCDYLAQCAQHTNEAAYAACQRGAQKSRDEVAQSGCIGPLDDCTACTLGLSCQEFFGGFTGTACEEACNAYLACFCAVNPNDPLRCTSN